MVDYKFVSCMELTSNFVFLVVGMHYSVKRLLAGNWLNPYRLRHGHMQPALIWTLTPSCADFDDARDGTDGRYVRGCRICTGSSQILLPAFQEGQAKLKKEHDVAMVKFVHANHGPFFLAWFISWLSLPLAILLFKCDASAV